MKELRPMKREPHRCSRCLGEKVSLVHREDIVDFRGLTLEVEGLAETKCDTCGFTWTTDGQDGDNLARIKEAFTKERDAIREREGLLNGEQVQEVLNLLGLSRSDAAALFGGGPNAFGKYISGEVLQSFAMDRLLRLTVGFGPTAVQFLNLGKEMPLQVGAAGIFLAPSISGSNAQIISSHSEGPASAMVGGDTQVKTFSDAVQ